MLEPFKDIREPGTGDGRVISVPETRYGKAIAGAEINPNVYPITRLRIQGCFFILFFSLFW